MKKRVLSFAVLSIALAIDARAEKVDATSKAAAEALFKEGRRLMGEGRFAEACPKLAESQRLDPAAGTLLNLGECFEKNGQTASAWATFVEAGRAADARKRPDWKATAEQRASALSQELSTLVIEVDPAASDVAVTRDGIAVGRAQWGAAIPIDPGEHAIEATAEGRVPYRTRVVVGKQRDRVVARIPPLARVTTTTTTTPPPATNDDGRATRSTLGIVALAVGGAGIATGAVFGILAANANAKVDRLCPSSPCADHDGLDANDRAHRFATVSTIGFVAGGVIAAAGVVLFVWPTPGGVAIGGTFR